MAIAFKNRNLTGGQNTSGNSTTNSVAAGDVLVAILHVDCRGGSGAIITGTLSDNQGNTWNRIGASESSAASHQQRTEIWIAKNTSFSGTLTTTVALSASAQAWTVQIQNYSGVVQMPTSCKITTNYTSSSISAAINDTNVNTTDAVVAFFTSNNTIPGGGPSGFTFADATTSGLSEVAQAYKIESSVVNETGNFGNAAWSAYGTLILYSAAVIVASNKFDGSGVNSGNGSATSSITYSAAAGDVVVIGIGAHSHTNFCRITGITDSGGLTWKRRRQEKFVHAYTSNSSDRSVLEYWYAYASSTKVSQTITITYDTTSNLDYSQAFWASFAGVANPSTKPWASDTSGDKQKFSNSGSTQLMTPSVTSQAAGDMLIGFYASLTKSPGSTPTTGTGVTNMGAGNASTGTAQGVGGVYNRAPSASTFQWNWNNAQNGYVSIGDALAISGAGSDKDYTMQVLSGTTSFASSSTGTPVTVTFQNTEPCTLLLFIHHTAVSGSGSFVTTTSVTDSAGHTWSRRAKKDYLSSYTDNSGLDEHTCEIWWADITAPHSSNVTITVNKGSLTGEGSATRLGLLGVIGSPSPTTPFKATGYNVAVNSAVGAAVSSPFNSAYTGTNLGDLVYAVIQAQTRNSGTVPTVGQTNVANVSVGTTFKQYSGSEYKLTAAASESGNMSYSSSSIGEYVLQSDVLVALGTGTAQEEPVTSATAPGATITVTTSVSASGAAGGGAGGQTLTDTVSIIAGTATAGSTANGATLTVTSSVIAGAATGGAVINGTTLTDTVSLIAGTAAVDNVANGATLTETVSLIAGKADVSVDGVTLTETVSLIAGGAGGGVAGQLLPTITSSIITQTPAAFVPQILTVTSSIIGQTPQATGGALVAGQTMTVDVSIFSLTDPPAGEYDFAEGATLNINVTLIPGTAISPDALIPGVTFPIGVSVIPDVPPAVGDGTVAAGGDTITVGVTLIPGMALGEDTTNNSVRPRLGGGVSLQQGIDAVAKGAIIGVGVRLRPGAAFAVEHVADPIISPAHVALARYDHPIERVDDLPAALRSGPTQVGVTEKTVHHHHTVERVVERAGDAGTHTVERVIEHVINATVLGVTIDAEMPYDESDDLLLMMTVLEDA